MVFEFNLRILIYTYLYMALILFYAFLNAENNTLLNIFGLFQGIVKEGSTHPCYCYLVGCWFSGSFCPSRASWPQSHPQRMRAACCGSFPASGCVTGSNWSPSRLGWGWGGGEVLHRVMTGWGGPPAGFCIGEEEEEVPQQGQSSVLCTGPPCSLQANPAEQTCRHKGGCRLL